MASSVVIRGGTVLDGVRPMRADVVVSGPSIEAVGPDLDVPVGATVLDADAAFVLPAFVDLHTHLREPGGERAETVESGTRSAALGGYRCVVAMPNTTPAIDSVEVVRELRDLSRDALCEVAIAAAITVGRAGERLSPMRELADIGIRLFTDDGRGVQSAELMADALTQAAALGVRLGQHCEIEALTDGGCMHEGAWSSRLGLTGQPAAAEVEMVARDLALVRAHGGAVHFLHLSTAAALELVRVARREGLAVTAEVTPHHLSLTDALVASFDPVYKVNPPLRPPSDVAAVRDAIRDGTIDAIATDHAPHPDETKDEPFDTAPFGMIGLETAFAVAHTELVAGEHLEVDDVSPTSPLTMGRLVELFASGPAHIVGKDSPARGGTIAPGAPAHLCVFDPHERWIYDVTRSASRSSNSPFAGRQLRGRVRHTVVGGEAVVIDAQAQR